MDVVMSDTTTVIPPAGLALSPDDGTDSYEAQMLISSYSKRIMSTLELSARNGDKAGTYKKDVIDTITRMYALKDQL
jgi:hypothetical protein